MKSALLSSLTVVREGLGCLVRAAAWQGRREARQRVRTRVLVHRLVAKQAERRLVVDRVHRDHEGLRRRRVVAAVQGAATVGHEDRHRRTAAGIRGQRVGHLPVRVDQRTGCEECVVVVAHRVGEGLGRLVAPPPGSAVAKPATVCGPESSFTVWSPSIVNEGSSFTGSTVITKVCDGAVSSPPFKVPPLSVTEDRHRGAARHLGGQRVGQLPVRVDQRTGCEECVVVVAHRVGEGLGRLVRASARQCGREARHRVRARVLVHRLVAQHRGMKARRSPGPP